MFGWKLSKQKMDTKSMLRKLGIDINDGCRFCNKVKEDIDNVFTNNDLVKIICAT